MCCGLTQGPPADTRKHAPTGPVTCVFIKNTKLIGSRSFFPLFKIMKLEQHPSFRTLNSSVENTQYPVMSMIGYPYFKSPDLIMVVSGYLAYS
jgi:hypothetical protein